MPETIIISEDNPRIEVIRRCWLTPGGIINTWVIKKDGQTIGREFFTEPHAVNYAKKLLVVAK